MLLCDGPLRREELRRGDSGDETSPVGEAEFRREAAGERLQMATKEPQNFMEADREVFGDREREQSREPGWLPAVLADSLAHRRRGQ